MRELKKTFDDIIKESMTGKYAETCRRHYDALKKEGYSSGESLILTAIIESELKRKKTKT